MDVFFIIKNFLEVKIFYFIFVSMYLSILFLLK